VKNLNFARKMMLSAILAASAFGSAAHAEDRTIAIDIGGIESNTYLDHPGNTILEFNLGANARINTFAWDVTLTALPGSFLADSFVEIRDSTQLNSLSFLPSEIANPGGGYLAGTRHYTGSVDFRTLDTPYGVYDYSFSLGPTGILRLEFAENMDNLAGADAIWNAGSTLTVGYAVAPVPEPETYAMLMLGLGAVGAMARRRRNRPAL
jgi:hypothetical protein